MLKKTFSCDCKTDVAFIPFMPATTKDAVELRVQILSLKNNALLDAEIYVDDIVIHSVNDESVERFYYFSNRAYYTAGSHTLRIRFRESGHEIWEESDLDFTIEKERLPILSGGFVMLGPPNDRIPCINFTKDTKAMTEGDWERYVDEMAALGIRCIIITASVQLRSMLGERINTAHYSSRLFPRSDITANDPIRAILRAAESNCQYVFIGLSHTYKCAPTNTTDIMDELHALYGDSPAFYGWYESEEANIRRCKDEVFERWKKLRSHASKLSPVKPFLISPYADGENVYQETGGVNPEFLKRISMGEGDFDIIAPQDMVGHTVKGGRLSVRESSEMFRHLSTACIAGNKHLWANCEAFDFNEEGVLVPRFEGGGMNGENGYIQQLDAVYPYAEKTVTFMLNGFFSPKGYCPSIGGALAEAQCESYRAYLKALN